MREVEEGWNTSLVLKGSRTKIRRLVCLPGSTEPALKQGLGARPVRKQACICRAGRRRNVSASHMLALFRVRGQALCNLRGPASLDLLRCVLVCFGSGPRWEISSPQLPQE